MNICGVVSVALRIAMNASDRFDNTRSGSPTKSPCDCCSRGSICDEYFARIFFRRFRCHLAAGEVELLGIREGLSSFRFGGILLEWIASVDAEYSLDCFGV